MVLERLEVDWTLEFGLWMMEGPWVMKEYVNLAYEIWCADGEILTWNVCKVWRRDVMVAGSSCLMKF